MPGPVELVLEGVLPVADVRGLADVRAVQLQARPLHEHLPPRREAAGSGGAALYTPRPDHRNKFNTDNNLPSTKINTTWLIFHPHKAL